MWNKRNAGAKVLLVVGVGLFAGLLWSCVGPTEAPSSAEMVGSENQGLFRLVAAMGPDAGKLGYR